MTLILKLISLIMITNLLTLMNPHLYHQKKCRTREGFSNRFSNFQNFTHPLPHRSHIPSTSTWLPSPKSPSPLQSLPSTPSPLHSNRQSPTQVPATPSPLSSNPPSPKPAPFTPSPILQHGYDDVDEFIWHDVYRGPREFDYTGSPGVKEFSEDPSCPLSILKLFLCDKLIDDIVFYTNTYVNLMKNTPNVIERLLSTERSIFKM